MSVQSSLSGLNALQLAPFKGAGLKFKLGTWNRMQQARIMALSGSRMKDMDAKLICCTRMRRSSSYTVENVRVQQEKETKKEEKRESDRETW